MKILVTGGTGYIGSHTVLCLIEAGYQVTVVDSLVNSSRVSLERIEKLTGIRPAFYEGDIRDRVFLDKIFQEDCPDCVIHFAGLKAVGESTEKPLLYYDNNIRGTITLLEVMEDHGCRNIVFSSSATVYGDPDSVPIKEDAPVRTTNPYGSTKLMIENIIRDVAAADERWNAVILRYFNPIGAHESGQMGEDPEGIPNNLMPYIARVAVGRLPKITVFGNDYDTPDGTGVRDYIHVMDLARGHVAAVKKISTGCSVKTYNLGTGKGVSVLELIKAFEKACGKELPWVIGQRRAGDIAASWADASLAEKELGWKAELGIDEMCRDTWNWQSRNPEGYRNA